MSQVWIEASGEYINLNQVERICAEEQEFDGEECSYWVALAVPTIKPSALYDASESNEEVYFAGGYKTLEEAEAGVRGLMDIIATPRPNNLVIEFLPETKVFYAH